MSDKPLFQNTDEQEATYAPQQLPAQASDRQATNAEASAGSDILAPVDVVPTAGVAFEAAGIGTGAGVSSGTAGTTGGIVPAVGAVALAQETKKKE